MGEFDEFDAPPAKAAPSAGAAAAGDFSEFEGASAGTPGPRSFWQRAYDSVTHGAHAVGHVVGEQADLARRVLTDPAETLATPEGRAAAADQSLITNPSKRREFERGVDDVVTLGYGQRLANKVGQALGDQGLSQEQQEKDAAAAPEYRTAGNVTGSVVPNPVGKAVGALGKVGGAVASKVAPEFSAAVSNAASKVPGVIAAPAKNVAAYEATAPVSAAASADAEGHRLEAAKAAAMDPAGLVLSVASGAAPAAAKGLGRTAREIAEKAPEAEAEQLMRGVMAGDETHGRATKTAAKLLTPKQEAAVAVLRSDKELQDASAKPAKQALPVFYEKLDEVGSKLDPHYDVVDKATGGTSMHSLVNFLDDEVARLKTEPGNRRYLKAIADIKRDALGSWAPGMEDELAGRQRAVDMGLTPRKEIPDVLVSTKRVRKYVTRLQKIGTESIDSLDPGEASQMKADMAGMMKTFIDGHLEAAAEKSSEVARAVAAIHELNPQYSALASMTHAIEQRQWGEQTGSTSFGGHVANLVKHGGAAAALPLAASGNIPGAVMAVAAPHLTPALKQIGQGAVRTASSAVRSPSYQPAIERLARAARAATSAADFVAQATRAGMGAAAARRIYETAHPPGSNAPSASVPVETTKLTPTEEAAYQKWKATLPDRLRYEGDYDLRGFFKKNPNFSVDVPGQHMTDEFKLPNHPTFSDESRYYNNRTKHLGGHWEGDVFIPNDTRFKRRIDESPGASP